MFWKYESIRVLYEIFFYIFFLFLSGDQSIVALGAIVGSLLGAFTVQRFGRKPTIMFSALFYVLGWCLISFGKIPALLHSGRVISGVGVGIAALSVPVSFV